MFRSLVFSFLVAVALFAGLFGYRYTTGPTQLTRSYGEPGFSRGPESGPKNYASAKIAAEPTTGPGIGDSQKFEKVATTEITTTAYDDDRMQVLALVADSKGLVQFEQSQGLAGRRVANYSFGVPADAFDNVLDDLSKIGKTRGIEVVKNDKTNEYRELRAQRATLEKARADLEALKAVGGSIDERLNVQGRLTDIERQIQSLGVSLGDYDGQNEFCTIRLTLSETRPAAPLSRRARVEDALEWATLRFAGLGIGLFCLSLAGLILAAVVRGARQFDRKAPVVADRPVV